MTTTKIPALFFDINGAGPWSNELSVHVHAETEPGAGDQMVRIQFAPEGEAILPGPAGAFVMYQAQAAELHRRLGEVLGPSQEDFHGGRARLIAERDRLAAENERLLAAARRFPLQVNRRDPPGTPNAIPWAVAELAYATYAAHYGRRQSLERLADRGGFGIYEMDTLLPDWRERIAPAVEIEHLRARVAELERRLAGKPLDRAALDERDRLAAENERLRAEVARMRPVFGAAQRVIDDAQPSLDALVDAVERAGEKDGDRG